jgi:hypothetical protein
VSEHHIHLSGNEQTATLIIHYTQPVLPDRVAAMKDLEEQRDKMEHAADDVLGFVKQMAELPRAPVLNPVQTLWDMSVKAQRLLKAREAAYDKKTKQHQWKYGASSVTCLRCGAAKTQENSEQECP